MGDLGKGKNKVDDIGETKHAVTHQKPLDVIRLSSKSTPDRPRLLGGTTEEARAYLDGLSEADRQAFRDYMSYYDRLRNRNYPNPTGTAKEAYPHGYEFYKEWQKIRNRKPKKSTNQPGESSTQEPYDDWFYRMGYPR